MVSFILSHSVGFGVLGISTSILVGILVIILIMLWKKVTRLERTLTTFCAGKDGAHLEDALLAMRQDLGALDGDIHELFSISNKIHALANRSIHKVAMIRFNPFQELGGNQSFSLALLDGKDNGVIISSLHTREGTRVYSKAIKNGHTEKHELTDEEQSVLTDAIAQKVIVAPTRNH